MKALAKGNAISIRLRLLVIGSVIEDSSYLEICVVLPSTGVFC